MRHLSLMVAGVALFGSALFGSAPFGTALAAAQAPQGAAPAGQGGQGGRGGGFVAYPQRPPGDPASIERGKTLWGVNCTFCHGPDARGGDGGGPNLLRSSIMLDDQKGELIAPVVQKGRGAMVAIPLTTEQIVDIAAFLHSIPVSSRTGPSSINILVGDVKRGQQYVAQRCAKCHTTDALRAFAAKLDDPRALQQMWLVPGSGGRGAGPSNAPIPAPPIRAVVTMPSGERIEGTVDHLDDFSISLRLAGGARRTIRTVGTTAKVELIDPLQPHKDLLPTYTDADIHDVTAYIASLRSAR
jgi:mono/diheme cytochrome c family protein